MLFLALAGALLILGAVEVHAGHGQYWAAISPLRRAPHSSSRYEVQYVKKFPDNVTPAPPSFPHGAKFLDTRTGQTLRQLVQGWWVPCERGTKKGSEIKVKFSLPQPMLQPQLQYLPPPPPPRRPLTPPPYREHKREDKGKSPQSGTTTPGRVPTRSPHRVRPASHNPLRHRAQDELALIGLCMGSTRRQSSLNVVPMEFPVGSSHPHILKLGTV